MHHFFVEPEAIEDKKIYIRGKDVNHIKNVLRMSPGDEISVTASDSVKEYRCRILNILPDVVECDLEFIKEEGNELPSKIYLFQGLPKSDKMETIIQKCVELGVYEIIPVEMKRSVMKIDEKKAASKTARYQAISEAAAKQSKRSIIPGVSLPMSVKKALEYAKDLDVKLLPYELSQGFDKTREILNNINPGDSIGIFIGPEGGFDVKEVEEAKEAGFIPLTLGKRILRTETAGMVVISWLNFLMEGR